MRNPYAYLDRNERINLVLYMAGIFTWKFALETLSPCVSGIVLNRLDYDPVTKKASSSAGLTWTTMQSINLAAQVCGVLLVGPLFKRFRPVKVLATAAFSWAAIMLFIPIIELATGGSLPRGNGLNSRDPSLWGKWDARLLYLFFTLAGLFSGIVELIRRVIPANIMGGDFRKLKTMDASVHISNEIAGTVGAFLARLWISYFGWGYSLGMLPIGFWIAALLWYSISPRPERLEYEAKRAQMLQENPVSMFQEFIDIVTSAAYAIVVGMRLIFTRRNLIWLIPCYSLALVGHRYLEGVVFPFYAKDVYGNTDLQTILTGGSNFGELLGGILVLLTIDRVPTPIPWIRSDAILILLIWVFPYYKPNGDFLSHAWSMSPIMALISMGWSAGDTSLAAYVQSILKNEEDDHKSKTTPLHAVMSFLYIANLIFYFIVNYFVGTARDQYRSAGGDPFLLMVFVAAIPMTVAGVFIFGGSFIPRGSCSMNPVVREAEDVDLQKNTTLVNNEKN